MSNVIITVNGKERSVRFNSERLCFECNVGYKDNNFKYQSRVVRGNSIDELKDNIVLFEERLQSTLITMENVTFKAFADYYINNIAPIDNEITTINSKRSQINQIKKRPEIADCKLTELTTIKLQAYYGYLYSCRKPNTVAAYHELIGTILNCAVRLGIIKTNPNENCVVKSFQTAEKIYWDIATCKRFLEFLQSDPDRRPLYKPTLCAMFTGLRRGEILGIKKDAFDSKNKTVLVKGQLRLSNGKCSYVEKLKTRTTKRRIKLNDKVYNILTDFDTDNNTEFAFSYKNKHWHSCTFAKKLKEAFTDFGYPNMTIKHLRSSFVKTNILSGTPTKIIQMLLGHARITTTMDIYGELLNEDTYQYADNMLATWETA